MPSGHGTVIHALSNCPGFLTIAISYSPIIVIYDLPCQFLSKVSGDAGGESEVMVTRGLCLMTPTAVWLTIITWGCQNY